ncbi:MarR family transcriptional regulator [Micromonospora halotolerans]|uniref:MarR family transcriptional regulator n=1 Tax=Micromonospora halotolerans TaxID=709879 RepID=A0ABY9ZPU3_9ACTN|nr:MarR family transcriptional regulator [Micromonospora halotolerans]WNM37301.1 MarR family transcriptional regulator [Micromonospora halotolerans]
MGTTSRADVARQQEINGRVSTLLQHAASVMVVRKADCLAPFDLTVTQYTAMLMLRCNPGSSSAQLARLCRVTPQSMSVVTAALEKRGLAQRTPAAIHPRVLALTLTRRGAALLARADLAAREVDARYEEEFSADELAALRHLLERARRVLDDPEKSARPTSGE